MRLAAALLLPLLAAGILPAGIFSARAAMAAADQPGTGTMYDGANARLSLPPTPAPPPAPPAPPDAASPPGGAPAGPTRNTATGTGVGGTSQEGESKGGEH